MHKHKPISSSYFFIQSPRRTGKTREGRRDRENRLSFVLPPTVTINRHQSSRSLTLAVTPIGKPRTTPFKTLFKN